MKSVENGKLYNRVSTFDKTDIINILTVISTRYHVYEYPIATSVVTLSRDRHSRLISLRGFIGPPHKSSEVATISFVHEGGRHTCDIVLTPGLYSDLILGLDFYERETSSSNDKTRRVTFDKLSVEPRNRANTEPVEIPGAPEKVQAIVDEFRETLARYTAELGRSHEFRWDIPRTGKPFRHTQREH